MFFNKNENDFPALGRLVATKLSRVMASYGKEDSKTGAGEGGEGAPGRDRCRETGSLLTEGDF